MLLDTLGLAGDQLWSVVENAPDGFVITDAAGTILLVNEQTERMFGWDRAELVGRPVELLVPRDAGGTHVEHRARYASDPRTRRMGMGIPLEGRRRDGTQFPLEVSLSPISTPAGALVIAAVRDTTDRQEIEQRAMLAERELARMEDRQRIARELHDTVVQRLFATGMALQALALQIEHPDHSRRLEAAVDDLDETIREVRTAIFGLRSHLDWAGGVRGEVLAVTTEAGRVLGHEPRLTFEGPVDTLVPESVVPALVATLRECLAAVAQRGRGREAEVRLHATIDEIVLTVADDAPVPHASIPATVTERARDLGGQVSAEGLQPVGAVLEWRVPTARNGSAGGRPATEGGPTR